MRVLLSVLMITKNSQELLSQSLSSIADIADEIIIVDDHSTDDTLTIAKKFNATIFQNQSTDLGAKRSFGLSKCRGEWILMLDADEIVTSELASSIKHLTSNNDIYAGYLIAYQNHLFGKPIHYGGENYKILRLFRKDSATIVNNFIHEHVQVKGKVGKLKEKIFHYSYRSLGQIIAKFTDYAKREAKKKVQNNETTSLMHLIKYPAHMMWARYIKDRGYKDGIARLVLDISFGYMEFCTYFFMFFEKRKK